MKIKPNFCILVFVLFLLPVGYLQSQSFENSEKEDRWFVGSGAGFQFGTITSLEISPRVGYMITKKWAAGIGTTYIYYRNKKFATNGTEWFSIERHIYGGSLFTRYFVYNNFFAHMEYELLRYEQFAFMENPDRIEPVGWETLHTPFIGGGYRQPLGSKAFFNIMVLFNLNETLESPYSNPIIKMGLGFGF